MSSGNMKINRVLIVSYLQMPCLYSPPRHLKAWVCPKFQEYSNHCYLRYLTQAIFLKLNDKYSTWLHHATHHIFSYRSPISLEAENWTLQFSGDQHFIVEYDSSPPVDENYQYKFFSQRLAFSQIKMAAISGNKMSSISFISESPSIFGFNMKDLAV